MRYTKALTLTVLLSLSACSDGSGDAGPVDPPPPDPLPPTLEVVSGDTVVNMFYDPATFWLRATDDVGLDSVAVDWGDLADNLWRYWSREILGEQTDLTIGVPTPSYGQAGIAVIQFRVVDKEGLEATATHHLRILDPPPTVQIIRKEDVSDPGAAFSADSAEVGAYYRLVYEFYDSGGFRPDAPIEIQWGDATADTIGTGTSSGGRWHEYHPYAEPASYEITLYVTDDAEQTTQASHTVVIYDPQTP